MDFAVDRNDIPLIIDYQMCVVSLLTWRIDVLLKFFGYPYLFFYQMPVLLNSLEQLSMLVLV